MTQRKKGVGLYAYIHVACQGLTSVRDLDQGRRAFGISHRDKICTASHRNTEPAHFFGMKIPSASLPWPVTAKLCRFLNLDGTCLGDKGGTFASWLRWILLEDHTYLAVNKEENQIMFFPLQWIHNGIWNLSKLKLIRTNLYCYLGIPTKSRACETDTTWNDHLRM